MNTNSKLRYLINLYGEKINISNLYDMYKKNILNIENAKDVTEEQKLKIIDSFNFGIKELDEGLISKLDAKTSLLNNFIENDKAKRLSGAIV